MEKIAELRRRRHRDMSENLSENLSEEGIDKSPLLSMDSAAVLPPEESSSSLLRAPSNGQKRKSAAAEDAKKELANSAGGEQFFNGGQLRTLLTRIDVEDITGEMDNLQLPPSQQQQQYSPPVSVKRQAVPQQSPRQSGVSRRATYQTNRNRRLSTLLSNEEVEDSKQSDEFCINIPRTSLGPMVVGYKRANTISSGIMRGLGQLRRRSKTVAQMLDGDSLDASGDDDMAERRMLRRKSDDDLDLQLAGHEAENQELRKELAGLHESVRALAKLAAANKFSAEAEEHRRELEQWLGSQ
ncbi:hypothetical protein FBU59_005025 [Linderina macrospora]|uniref:Uncharacterized protein n=1 Tax=Linderina macrospora TaxID=4868 RepID=A0ACC1J407_9FUNG|nr:hypothetical protein FBU59_005025 [Linderina macrospora]